MSVLMVGKKVYDDDLSDVDIDEYVEEDVDNVG
jgi:hypothetical protein